MIFLKIGPEMGFQTVLTYHTFISFANIITIIIIKSKPFYSRIFISLLMRILIACNFIT